MWKIAEFPSTGAEMRRVKFDEDDPLAIGKAMSATTQMSGGSWLWLLTFAALLGAESRGMQQVVMGRRVVATVAALPLASAVGCDAGIHGDRDLTHAARR